MERVLVTGCRGFVGKALVPLLKNSGFEVWGLDRIEDHGSFEGDRYFSLDLSKGQDVSDLLAEAKPDFIVHLAAQSSAGISFGKPLETLSCNVFGTLHILDALRKRPCATRLLAVGSAEEYGPVSEDDLPLREDRRQNPINPYSLSKVFQNECCRLYSRLYDIDVVLTRSFNHTGGGQTDTFVLPAFARQIAEVKYGLRNPVLATGNLDIRRDFLDVRDVAKAYALLLKKGKKGETYNVCSGRSYRLSDLLKEMSSIAGVEVKLRLDPAKVRPIDTMELRGDNSKIAQDTGWSPETQIRDTLIWLLEYWDEKVKHG